MTQTILKSIEDVTKSVREGPGGEPLAKEVRDQAVLAIKKGMDSPEWEVYMKRFATSDPQLRRLCGKEDEYMGTDYGLITLAYVAGNGVCTMTSLADTTRYLDAVMRDGLDKDMPNEAPIS